MSKKKKKASRKPAKKPPRMWLPADTFAAPPPFDDGLIDPDELGDLPIGTFPHLKTPLGNLAFGNLSLDDLSLDDLPPDERRIVEGMLGQFAAEMGFDGPPQNSALGKAQEMIYAAADERNPKQRIAKVKKALSICPDCADAYVMLAECATSEAEAADSGG